MNEFLELVGRAIYGLYGLPGYMLVFLSCLVVGFIFKRIRAFPNDGIPALICLWGAVFNILVAEECKDGCNHRIWVARSLLIGIIIGFLAWRSHKYVKKKFQGTALEALTECDSQPPFRVDGSRVSTPSSGVVVNQTPKSDI